MRKLAAALTVACAVLAFASAASAAPAVGVAEDQTKYSSDGGAALYAQMKAYGLTSNRISVFWNFTSPTTIEEKAFLDKVVPTAAKAGVQLVFAIYADPRPGGGAQAAAQDPNGFCNYAGLVAKTYPSVTKIIVGNEPNQPRFWQPQFVSGAPVSGAQYEPVLAKCYDVLKAVNPSIDVIGVGLSPRGNDDANATSNVSTSPVHFIHDMAAAYRASGRQQPLMDEFAQHCYPNVNTDSLQHGYQWPNIGCVNFDRVKQGVWDGFNGTAQPTFAEPGVSLMAVSKPMTLVVDETGWQVDVSGHSGYSGAENVPTIDEATQSSIYAGLVGIAACDPSITALHFLYLLDSSNLVDFQSGMFRVDDSARPSAGAVKSAIGQGCTGGTTSWSHTTKVIDAKASRSVVNGRRAVELTATEDYSFTITFTKKGKRPVTATKKGLAYYNTEVVVPVGYKGGKATVKMSAWANPSRTSSFSVTL